MTVSENIYTAGKEVIARANSVNFFTPNSDSTELKKVVLCRIKHPNIWGSAYWLDSGIEVGVGTMVGYTTGAYVWQNGTKYIEIELLLPGILQEKYNRGAGAREGLIKKIQREFKNKKEYKGCILFTEVPATIWVQENKFSYADEDGTMKSYVDQNATDPELELVSTGVGTENDGSKNQKESTTNNTTLLAAGALLLLKFLK